MKTLKILFYGISISILAVCIAILAIAMNPEWSQKLSQTLYGEDGQVAEAAPTPTVAPETGEDNTESGKPLATPMVYATEAPADNSGESVEKEDWGDYQPKTIDIKMVCPPAESMTAYVDRETKQEIPPTVSSLCGSVEIAASMSEVEADEAAELRESLSEGDTGALLVFEQRFYPYYHMLNAEEKELYRQIYANAFSMYGAFKPCVDIFSTNIGKVVEAVFCDNPVLFWVEPAYTCRYDRAGRVVEITLQYNETAGKAEQSKQKFDEKAEEILRVARTLGSDYEKEKYVHDKLTEKVTYAADAAMNQSAYSALVNGKTVCAGYTRAFQYLLQQLGIPCYYCRGYSGVNHAWNIVELYGAYYNVDVTWGDTEPATYTYFNRTDEDLAGTHARRSMSVKLPACTGTLYRGLELEEDEVNPGVAAGLYSEGLAVYYEQLSDRIEALRNGRADYSDIMDIAVWKELEEAYTNGNHDFRDDYLIRALQSAEAEYCIISLSAEQISAGAVEVSCSLLVE